MRRVLVLAPFVLATCRPAATHVAPVRGVSSPVPVSVSSPVPVIVEYDVSLGAYTFRSGESLPDLRVHYATAGTPRRDASGRVTNAILLLHWTSASSAALRTPEYVSALFGASGAIDLDKHFVVFLDSVGHGKSSKPSDGLHARFPKYGYRDMVDIQHRVITETLDIARLEAIIGMSMGGMHSWMWAEEYPEAVGAIMPVVALPVRISGRNLIWRRIVSRSIRTDPAWNGGEYAQPPRGWTEAFPLFRMMLDGVPHLDATVRDRADADRFIQDAADQARQLDANDVLYSLESSGDYDPEPKLSNVRAKVYALNFSDDEFNPVALHTMERVIQRVPGARFVIQDGTPSSFGHMTQAHPSLWAEHLATFVRDLETR